MIRKDLNFFYKKLQSVAILDKKFKFLVLIFFNFDSFFFQSIFHYNIPLDSVFQMIPNLLNSFKCSKSYNDLKN